ncbi:MAG: phosphatidylserine decarboxylase [Bacteroidales bacterium]|nr:phosphatidylserine decarboxylase [Bacteroidales bacterium]
MKIDKNSYGSIAIIYICCAAVIAAMFLLVRIDWLDWTITGVAIWVAVWQTKFFLVPNKKVTSCDKNVLSVADGRVVIVEQEYEGEYLKRDCIKVSVYMNFFDYHANFWPVKGTVTYYKYHPGKHFFAFKPKSSQDNEHTCTAIKTPEGHEILFKQIAGGFARRIVNYAKPGLSVEAGAQCGIIKFGSRIDIFLPLDAQIKVKVGDLAVSCESVIATL